MSIQPAPTDCSSKTLDAHRFFQCTLLVLTLGAPFHLRLAYNRDQLQACATHHCKGLRLTWHELFAATRHASQFSQLLRAYRHEETVLGVGNADSKQ